MRRPDLPARGPAGRARPSAHGAVAAAPGAADEHVEPRVAVPAAQPMTTGDDVPAARRGPLIVGGEEPVPGRLQTVQQPANKAVLHLVFAGRGDSVDQHTVPSAHPRARMVSGLGRCDRIGPASFWRDWLAAAYSSQSRPVPCMLRCIVPHCRADAKPLPRPGIAGENSTPERGLLSFVGVPEDPTTVSMLTRLVSCSMSQRASRLRMLSVSASMVALAMAFGKSKLATNLRQLPLAIARSARLLVSPVSYG
jgi:hypothetical protein